MAYARVVFRVVTLRMRTSRYIRCFNRAASVSAPYVWHDIWYSKRKQRQRIASQPHRVRHGHALVTSPVNPEGIETGDETTSE